MTEYGEIIDPKERAKAALSEYGRIEVTEEPGNMTFEFYDRLYQACQGVELEPEQALLAAWIGLERSLAMPGSYNPATDKRFQPKEISAARARVVDDFNALITPDAPLRVRLDATLAAGSVHRYGEAMRLLGRRPSRQERLGHIRSINRVAQMAVNEIDELNPEDGDAIALLELINELGGDLNLVALPAPPRQPWLINAYNHTRTGLAWLPINIAEDQHPFILNLHPSLLGNDRWSSLQARGQERENPLEARYDELPTGRNATLQALARMAPGLIEGLTSSQGMSTHELQLQVPLAEALAPMARDILMRLKSQQWYAHINKPRLAPPKSPAPEPVVPEEEPPVPLPDRSLQLEALWYLKRQGDSLDEAERRTLLIHLRNLEASESEEDGLLPMERYALGWMRLEHAMDVFENEGAEAAEEWFRDAARAFIKSAEDFLRPPRRPGMACEALLAFEGALIYADVFTNSNRQAMREEVGYYKTRLAVLFEKIREHQGTLSDNPEEMQTLMYCAERTTLALLLMGASDPAMRHLVLPMPARGPFHRNQLVAYHLDTTEEEADYITDTPIHVRIVDGQEVTHAPGRLLVGRGLLADPNDPLGFLSELAEVIRPPQPAEPEQPVKKAKKKKPQPQKKIVYKKGQSPKAAAQPKKPAQEEAPAIPGPTRTEAADAVTTAIASGVTNAYQSQIVAERRAQMSARQLKKERRGR